MDARRHANRLYDGQILRGPLKIFDTTPALIGSLFAEKHGDLITYCEAVFAKFFAREFAADDANEVAQLIKTMGLRKDDYFNYLNGEGVNDLEASLDEAAEDHIFGVPIFVFKGEQFWGADRIWLLEETLKEAGLARNDVL